MYGQSTRRVGEFMMVLKDEQVSENYSSQSQSRSSGERWVTMSNALVRAGHGLTLAEKRIVMCAVSKLDSRAALKPGELPRTKITASEYAEIASCKMNAAYEALQEATKTLFNRKITFYETHPAPNSRSIHHAIRTEMRWVGRCRYHAGEGWVELVWWPDLLPSLIGLKKQFTSYQLQQAHALRSVYSWRLLELLTRYKSTGWAEYTVEDFAASMNATEKQKSDFGKIRTKIIQPAVKELIEKDNWKIEWHPIKAGRRVAKIRFDFKKCDQGKLF